MKLDANDIARDHGPDGLRERVLIAVAEAPTNGNGKHVTAERPPAEAWPDFEDSHDTLDNPPPRPAELIESVCYVGSKISMSGPSKSMKTFFQMYMALCIATGTPWFGRKVLTGRVLYINLELIRYSFASRQKAILDQMDTTLGTGRLTVWHLRGKNVTIERLKTELASRLRSEQFDLIIIDPLYKVLGARSENDASEMGDLLRYIESIGHAAGAAILIAHHYAKGNASGKNALDRSSGSGVIGRDGDAIIDLCPHEEDDCLVMELIQRDMPPIAPVVLRWQYPCFTPDDSLDPNRLKLPVKRESREVTDADVLDAAAGFPKNRDQLIAALTGATNCGVNKCRNAISRVIGAGLLDEIRTRRKGTNPLIQYRVKESGK